MARRVVLEYNTMTEVGALLKGLKLGKDHGNNVTLIGVENRAGAKTVVLEVFDDEAKTEDLVGGSPHAGGDASGSVEESGS